MSAIRLFVCGLIVGLVCTVATGQVSAPSSVAVNDEGVLQGQVRSLNFVGAGVVSTVVAGVGVVTIAGAAGGSTLTEIEIDFGAAACGTTDIGPADAPDHCQATITDATVTATSKIIAFQAGLAATSRDQDENDFDQIVCNANPGTGTFVLFCRSADGASPIFGKFKIWYLVTA